MIPSARGWIAIAAGSIATLGAGGAAAVDSAFDRMVIERSAVSVYRPAAAAPAQVVPNVETRSYSFDFNERYPLDLRRPQPAILVPAGTTTQPIAVAQPTVIVEAPAPAVAAPTVAAPAAATPPIASPQAIADAGVRSPSPLVDGRKFGRIETPRSVAAPVAATPVSVAATPAPPAGAIAPEGRRLGPAKVEPAPLQIDDGRGTEQRIAALPPRPAVAGSDEAVAVLLRDFAPPLPPGAGGATPAVALPPTTGVAPPPDTGPDAAPGKLRRHDYAFPSLGRQGGPFEAPGRMSTPVALPSTNR